jgi:hypothetical protein
MNTRLQRLSGRRLPICRLGLAIAGLLLCTQVLAQSVYRCEANGQVSYSHEPCLGATVVDTTPTQGLDKSSGTSRKGADVLRIEQRQRHAEAVRPIVDISVEEREIKARRRKLPPADQIKCRALDRQIPELEAAVEKSTPETKESAEARLFVGRNRYRSLGC